MLPDFQRPLFRTMQLRDFLGRGVLTVESAAVTKIRPKLFSSMGTHARTPTKPFLTIFNSPEVVASKRKKEKKIVNE